MSSDPDPTKGPEFQKVLRNFVTTAPNTHDEMQAEKHKTESDGKASPKNRQWPSPIAMAQFVSEQTLRPKGRTPKIATMIPRELEVVAPVVSDFWWRPMERERR